MVTVRARVGAEMSSELAATATARAHPTAAQMHKRLQLLGVCVCVLAKCHCINNNAGSLWAIAQCGGSWRLNHGCVLTSEHAECLCVDFVSTLLHICALSVSLMNIFNSPYLLAVAQIFHLISSVSSLVQEKLVQSHRFEIGIRIRTIERLACVCVCLPISPFGVPRNH